jgi:hypothetical protein
MARYVWCKVSECWMDAEQFHGRSPSGSGPHLIRDDLGKALRHPVTGAVTDSKSAFRRMTKASGCIEVGDQAIPPARKPDLGSKSERKAAIAAALNRLGY